MGMRRRARELALQLLYQHEHTGADLKIMQTDFDEWTGAGDKVRVFADRLLRGTLDHLDELDDELARQTAHWRLERLAAVDRNILRLAMFELLFETAVQTLLTIARDRLGATLATLLVIGFSTATAMGLAGYLDIRLTPISVTAPTIILTMAIASSVPVIYSQGFHELQVWSEWVSAGAWGARAAPAPS